MITQKKYSPFFRILLLLAVFSSEYIQSAQSYDYSQGGYAAPAPTYGSQGSYSAPYYPPPVYQSPPTVYQNPPTLVLVKKINDSSNDGNLNNAPVQTQGVSQIVNDSSPDVQNQVLNVNVTGGGGPSSCPSCNNSSPYSFPSIPVPMPLPYPYPVYTYIKMPTYSDQYSDYNSYSDSSSYYDSYNPYDVPYSDNSYYMQNDYYYPNQYHYQNPYPPIPYYSHGPYPYDPGYMDPYSEEPYYSEFYSNNPYGYSGPSYGLYPPPLPMPTYPPQMPYGPYLYPPYSGQYYNPPNYYPTYDPNDGYGYTTESYTTTTMST